MMDRPEWTGARPRIGGFEEIEVYCTLTNNNRRGTQTASVNAPDGSLYAATSQGLLKIDRSTAKASRLTAPALRNTLSALIGRDGTLYAGTAAGFSARAGGWTICFAGAAAASAAGWEEGRDTR